MNVKKPAALLVAATALLAGSTVSAAAAETGNRVVHTRSTAAASDVQQRIDAVLAAQPGGRQVSANKVHYDGLDVTVYPASKANQAKAAALACDYGWLCMNVRGTVFKYYKCQLWSVSNWYGDGDFVNNQMPGTVARFYNKDGRVRWTSTAYAAPRGTRSITSVYYVRPC
ncbi:hypothetical protein ABZV31_10560 [Streptomyces sp. NPDC005202]|uniref:hypothetical protein n=1 Tax=Streptomyces sp. NPDC005202 TaxID=3157021 RepID=UPI00339F1642